MEKIKYPYSIRKNSFNLFVTLTMFSFLVYFFIVNISDPDIWMIGIFILMVAALLVYFFRKYISPSLKGVIALELDDEKLQYFISNKTVYWKNVNYIECGYGGRGGGLEVRFAIKESSKDITLSTRYIAGKDKDIYATISKYFEENK